MESEQPADPWRLSEHERIAVDANVVDKAWNPVPFDRRFFDYDEQQLKEKWPHLMRALRIPYPSAEYLRVRLDAYPVLKDELPAFEGDYEDLSRRILHVWRLFFRGDFRAAKEEGIKYGAFGKIPAYFGQILYAVYLSDNRTDKHQLLQDAIDQVSAYVDILEDMQNRPEFKEDYIVLRMGVAYAIGRIAEEVSPAVALFRNYLSRTTDASKNILEVDPSHPLGLAFEAGIDANIIRILGRFAGRLVFGARISNIEDGFEHAIRSADQAILRFEYANAMLYTSRRRDLNEVLDQLEQGMKLPPSYSMEALDAMYAAKRLEEVKDFARWGRSYRAYERERRRHVRSTDANLHNVLQPPFLVTGQ